MEHAGWNFYFLWKNPVSYGDKLRKLRKDGYLKKGKHYFQIGSSTSPIRYDIEELEKFFFDYVIRRKHHQARMGAAVKVLSSLRKTIKSWCCQFNENRESIEDLITYSLTEILQDLWHLIGKVKLQFLKSLKNGLMEKTKGKIFLS